MLTPPPLRTPVFSIEIVFHLRLCVAIRIISDSLTRYQGTQMQWTLSSLIAAPWWYLVVGILVSLYHGYRGFMIQWHFGIPSTEKFRGAVRILILCVEDTLFYVVCSVAGFLALLAANHLYETVSNIQTIDAGRSILLVFAFSIGIIGITGQLPNLIQQGKIPGVKN
mgnify:CR=1 FL=1